MKAAEGQRQTPRRDSLKGRICIEAQRLQHESRLLPHFFYSSNCFPRVPLYMTLALFCSDFHKKTPGFGLNSGRSLVTWQPGNSPVAYGAQGVCVCWFCSLLLSCFFAQGHVSLPTVEQSLSIQISGSFFFLFFWCKRSKVLTFSPSAQGRVPIVKQAWQLNGVKLKSHGFCNFSVCSHS